jgi:hypothetical protein
MSALSRIALLFAILGSGVAFAQQQQYDEDDEDALAQQQAAQQQQAQQPYGYPPPDPNAYANPNVVQYGYVGVHPLPYEVGSGFCYQAGPHFHTYAPFDQYLFRESGGYFYFVGDVGDFGYSAQVWGYQGHHPIPVAYGGGYCYIGWPHRHPFAPPTTYYNFVSGYYVYNGPWDPFYYRYRDHYLSYYGGYYRSNYYGGRYWVVRPPAIYRPSLVVGAPGVYRGGVTVTAPGVRVNAPGVVVPGARVYAPGARVYAPGPRVVAPPPAMRVAPPPAVRVAPPPMRRR